MLGTIRRPSQTNDLLVSGIQSTKHTIYLICQLNVNLMHSDAIALFFYAGFSGTAVSIPIEVEL